eukprot:7041933-Alexandrium_andersonii.AAC.1
MPFAWAPHRGMPIAHGTPVLLGPMLRGRPMLRLRSRSPDARKGGIWFLRAERAPGPTDTAAAT